MASKLISADQIEMTAEQYAIIKNFLEDSSGIVLGEAKQYLVKNRLTDLVLKLDSHSFAELVNNLQSTGLASKKIQNAVVDAMTTNETFWFRDDSQFVELKERILPELLKSKKSVKIWSAACSTGQEPYSISMCAENLLKTGYGEGVQILGTDISETALVEARRAVYSEMVVARGLDVSMKAAYFQSFAQGGYQVRSEIVRRVKFQQFNLLDSFTILGRFDIVFCRNVLIYFSPEVKRDILQRIASVLEPGGYLFLSSTESMLANMFEFESVRGERTRYFKKC